MRRSEIRPFAQVGLAEDDGPGGPEALDDEGVGRRRRTRQRARSGGGHHAIPGRDVVFEQNRDAVQRAAHAPAAPVGVSLVRDRERVGVELEDRIERRTIAIERLDAREILFRDPSRCAATRLLIP
jgi:hypothetical protein